MAVSNEWTAEAHGKDAVRITWDVAHGWEGWILLSGDRHMDSPDCRRDIAKRHYELAVERGAPILDIGDLFDVMQGRDDPRRSYSGLRNDHAETDYLDRVLDDVADFLMPYRDNLAVLCEGNHETNVQKRQGVNLHTNLRLRLRPENPWPFLFGYGGYVVLSFRLGGRRKHTVNLRLYHGSGGGGPVTKGVIQTNRRAVFMPDADVICTGHIHEGWVMPIQQEKLSLRGIMSHRTQYHVSVPTVKDEYNVRGNWHVERGAPPKPLGSAWLHLACESDGKGGSQLRVTPSLMLES